MIQYYYNAFKKNLHNSCEPHLNIFAFSGKTEHHLIETWRTAQFQKVSATQLGYSWYPSVATSTLKQDSSQQQSEENLSRNLYANQNITQLLENEAVAYEQITTRIK